MPPKIIIDDTVLKDSELSRNVIYIIHNHTGLPKTDIELDSILDDDLYMDYSDVTIIMAELEDIYSCEVDNTIISDINTVRDICKWLYENTELGIEQVLQV